MAREQNRGMGQSDHTLWALLKHGHTGTYHEISRQHLNRHVTEFAGRHGQRPLDTIERLKIMAQQFDGKTLRYKDPNAPNGLSSGRGKCLLL